MKRVISGVAGMAAACLSLAASSQTPPAAPMEKTIDLSTGGSIRSVTVDGYAVPVGGGLPFRFLKGRNICIEFDASLDGQQSPTTSCFTLSDSNGDPTPQGAQLIEGGCRFVAGGAVRATEIIWRARTHPRYVNHRVVEVAEVRTKRDAFGCAQSSRVGAVFTRGRVSTVRIESTPEDGATVRVIYEDGLEARAIGATSGDFQIPIQNGGETVLFYIQKPGYESCALLEHLIGDPVKLSCTLKRPVTGETP